jgi:hypothetical protein
MSHTTTRWTTEALAARLEAQAAIDAAPRAIAGLAAAEHLELLRTIDQVSTASLSANDAIPRLAHISEAIRSALQPA